MSRPGKAVDESAETLAARRESARRARRDFLAMGVAAAGGYAFYRYIDHARRVEMLQAPLRDALNFNHGVSEALFHEHALAPTYPLSKAVDLRINGNYGLKQDLKLDSYRLQVVGVENAKNHPRYVNDVTAWAYQYDLHEARYTGHDTKVRPGQEGPNKAARPPANQDGKPAASDASGMSPAFAAGYAAAAADDNKSGRAPRGNEEAGQSDSTLDAGTPGLLLTLEDITRTPKQDFVTQFQCIEGWSEYVRWGGYRLADFIAAYPPARNPQGQLPRFVYMETPNGDYYTGYELHECMHPQSLLVTEMAGQPLTQAHGAPLRLHMPIKYGYKQIKRIGLIAYTDDKPDDYWTKLGYDWYAGL